MIYRILGNQTGILFASTFLAWVSGYREVANIMATVAGCSGLAMFVNVLVDLPRWEKEDKETEKKK